MAIEKLTADLNIIQKLDDEPNDVGGLTAQELKTTFDKAGNTIQQYINGTLIPALETAGVEQAALLPEKDAGMKYIRLGATGDIEVSLDGETWVAVAGSGASMETVPAHAAKHRAGGTDPLTPDSIGAYTKEETETKIEAAVKAGIGDAMEASY